MNAVEETKSDKFVGCCTHLTLYCLATSSTLELSAEVAEGRGRGSGTAALLVDPPSFLDVGAGLMSISCGRLAPFANGSSPTEDDLRDKFFFVATANAFLVLSNASIRSLFFSLMAALAALSLLFS